jgi:hypothetical protein
LNDTKVKQASSLCCLQIKEGLVMETENNKTFHSLNNKKQSGKAESNWIELEATGGAEL